MLKDKLIFVDAETTGLFARKHEMVQLAAIIEIGGTVVEEVNIFLRPDRPEVAEPKALQVTGKTIEDLLAYPDRKEGFLAFKKIISKYINKFDKSDKFLWVGQNAPFDQDFVSAFFKEQGENFFGSYFGRPPVDLMSMSVAMQHAGKIELANRKLGTVAAALGIEFKAHDALEDIRVTRQIWNRYIDMIKGVEFKPAPEESEGQMSFLDGIDA